MPNTMMQAIFGGKMPSAVGRLRRRVRTGLPTALEISMASRTCGPVIRPWAMSEADTVAEEMRPPICAAVMVSSSSGKCLLMAAGTSLSQKSRRPERITHSMARMRGIEMQARRKSRESALNTPFCRVSFQGSTADVPSSNSFPFVELSGAFLCVSLFQKSTQAMMRAPPKNWMTKYKSPGSPMAAMTG